jgi:hypothetical protein
MTRVRHIYKCGLLALLGLLALHQPARADERILSFDSTITVARDGTLTVREVIRVRAEGANIKRGVYRDFPTTYPAARAAPLLSASRSILRRVMAMPSPGASRITGTACASISAASR